MDIAFGAGSILLYLIVILLGTLLSFFILYAIIKYAVKNAINESVVGTYIKDIRKP